MRRNTHFAAALLLLLLQGCGGGGSNSAAPGAPTVTISAIPGAVLTGDPTTLSWSSTNAASCTASGAWSGPEATSGTFGTGALSATSTYTLTCASSDGSMTAQDSVVVTVSSVTPPPTLTLNANPGTVLSGASSTLTWSSAYATSCNATGAWTGSRNTGGSQSTGALNASATYTLTCSGAGGQVTRSAIVTVTQPTGSYSTDFNLTENPISEGGQWHRANNIFTNVRTANGRAYGTNGVTNTYDDSYALLSGFGPNQTAEAVVYRSNSLVTGITHEVELLLHFADDSNGARGYECLFNYAGGIQIVRWDGQIGNFTDLTPSNAQGYGRDLVSGDVVKARIIGSVITVFVNGQQLAQVTDTTYADGQPGISFFTRPGGSSANFALDSYTVTSN